MKKSFVMSCLIALISFQMQAGLGRVLISVASFASASVIGNEVRNDLQKEEIKRQFEEVKNPLIKVYEDLKDKKELNAQEFQKLTANAKLFVNNYPTLVGKGLAAGLLSGFGLKNILCHHK